MADKEFITKLAARTAIENYACRDCVHSNGKKCEDCEYQDCINFINEVEAADVQPVNRWISVENRLPEEIKDKSSKSGWSEEIRSSDSVLILTTGGSYDVAWYSYVFNDWTSDNENVVYQSDEVAFWQPLPEPPETTKG